MFSEKYQGIRPDISFIENLQINRGIILYVGLAYEARLYWGNMRSSLRPTTRNGAETGRAGLSTEIVLSERADPMTRGEVTKFAKFVLVGGMSAIVSLLVRAFVSRFAIFEVAVVAAQVAGAIVAFTLNLSFVFQSFSGNRGPSFARFLLVNVASLVITTVISSALYRGILETMEGPVWGGYIAHFFGLAASSIPSYLAHKHFSFRETLGRDAA